jgi:hypothetical protein
MQVYFSYNIPYTCSDLCRFLDQLEEGCKPILKRRLAGISLVGNRLEFLTVTNFSLVGGARESLPAIVVLARAHPGETVSSWVMHEFLRFITSE